MATAVEVPLAPLEEVKKGTNPDEDAASKEETTAITPIARDSDEKELELEGSQKPGKPSEPSEGPKLEEDNEDKVDPESSVVVPPAADEESASIDLPPTNPEENATVSPVDEPEQPEDPSSLEGNVDPADKEEWVKKDEKDEVKEKPVLPPEPTSENKTVLPAEASDVEIPIPSIEKSIVSGDGPAPRVSE